jgi:hypothetical protein
MARRYRCAFSSFTLTRIVSLTFLLATIATVCHAAPRGSSPRKMTMKTDIATIEINGVSYVRADSLPCAVPNGKRAVVVVDRGWIFAGDVTEENGRVYLDRAVWVFRWESVGFAAVVADPKRSKADIRPLPTRVDIPAGSEVFRLPVSDSWGLL